MPAETHLSSSERTQLLQHPRGLPRALECGRHFNGVAHIDFPMVTNTLQDQFRVWASWHKYALNGAELSVWEISRMATALEQPVYLMCAFINLCRKAWLTQR